jgi:hypothetical protein
LQSSRTPRFAEEKKRREEERQNSVFSCKRNDETKDELYIPVMEKYAAQLRTNKDAFYGFKIVIWALEHPKRNFLFFAR